MTFSAVAAALAGPAAEDDNHALKSRDTSCCSIVSAKDQRDITAVPVRGPTSIERKAEFALKFSRVHHCRTKLALPIELTVCVKI